LLRTGLRLAIGPRLARVANQADMFGRFVWTWCAFHLAGKDEGKRYIAYRKIWQIFGDLSVATLAPDSVENAFHARGGGGVQAEGGRLSMARLCSGEAAGFYRLEKLGGVAFRWTSPIAVVRISSPDLNFDWLESVTLELLDIRPLEAKSVFLYHATLYLGA